MEREVLQALQGAIRKLIKFVKTFKIVQVFDQIPPCPLNHITNCHVYLVFEHFQRWWVIPPLP